MSEQIFFYILSAIIVIFSLLTVTSRKILRAAIYLLFVLIATAGLYFLFNVNFLAAVQLTVYAGGIVVLIIFSVFLTHEITTELEAPHKNNMIIGGLASIVGFFITAWTILGHHFKVSTVNLDASVSNIGTKMLSMERNGFVLPFEVISILLLAAMVAAIIVAKQKIKKVAK